MNRNALPGIVSPHRSLAPGLPSVRTRFRILHMSTNHMRNTAVAVAFCIIMSVSSEMVAAADSPPVISSIFPAGAAAGKPVLIELTGSGIDSVRSLVLAVPGSTCERLEPGRFRVSVPDAAKPGFYDLWAFSAGGLSAPVRFMVSRRSGDRESGDDRANKARHIALDVTIDGRILAAGETDRYEFEARKGQSVVFECFADRIDSRMRAVLELYDATGRRIASNRGHFGVDPMISWVAPADGTYEIRVHDLAYGGGSDFVYRLDVDTGPRPVFAVPVQVVKGQASKVKISGRNLHTGKETRSGTSKSDALSSADFEIAADRANVSDDPPVVRSISQAVADLVGVDVPNSHMPVTVALGDYDPKRVGEGHETPAKALEIAGPGDFSGQFVDSNVSNSRWFAWNVNRGEVFHFEVFSERLGAPTDLRLAIFDATGTKEIASFEDEFDLPDSHLPTGHADPAGRWVAPADGRFLIELRETKSGPEPDPRKIFVLSVRRDVPDFRIIALPAAKSAGAINVQAGGRVVFDLVALRRRGYQGPIRVFAENTPSGLSCPDVWIGPATDSAVMVVSADSDAATGVETLRLMSEADGIGRREVAMAAPSRGTGPLVRGRLVSRSLIGVAGKAAIRVHADVHRTFSHPLYGTLTPRHAQGGFADVAVRIDPGGRSQSSPVRLAFEGLPPQLSAPVSHIPAGKNEGWLSLELPATLMPGQYSFVVRAETTVTSADPSKPEAVVAFSEPVTIEVHPAAYVVEADPFTPSKAKRGESFEIRYRVRRRNGFIGKVHTELAVPGIVTTVPGLRGRGETFVGQTDQGLLKVVVNPDAPLGRVPFLRLLTIGVVEDEAIHQGADFLDLEIVE